MAVKTVGIDLSLTATGVAYSTGQCWVLGNKGVTTLSLADQIRVLNGLALQILDRCGTPDAVAIEALDMSQSYGGQIERTALWWDVVRQLDRANVPVFVVPSPQVKMYATGKGAGPKGAVIEALTRRWPQFDHAGNDNAADAAVCALIAAHMTGHAIGAPGTDGASYLPDTHLRALKSVRSIHDPPPPRKVRKLAPRPVSA